MTARIKTWDEFKIFRANKERELALIDVEIANHKAILAEEYSKLELLMSGDCSSIQESSGETDERSDWKQKVANGGTPAIEPHSSLVLHRPEFRHSDNYRNLEYQGKSYSVTRNQAIIIEVLDKAYIRGLPEVSSAELLEAIESRSSRIRDSFRNSPLWGTLVIKGSKKDMYRLSLSGFGAEV